MSRHHSLRPPCEEDQRNAGCEVGSVKPRSRSVRAVPKSSQSKHVLHDLQPTAISVNHVSKMQLLLVMEGQALAPLVWCVRAAAIMWRMRLMRSLACASLRDEARRRERQSCANFQRHPSSPSCSHHFHRPPRPASLRSGRSVVHSDIHPKHICLLSFVPLHELSMPSAFHIPHDVSSPASQVRARAERGRIDLT